ncbi:tumor necrosis factor receptor superfamily member 9a [Sebastes umbrosus]|uniref:tumor necrosis factor receptor superfamily member 9a n=1 Tax=Sebastes umbrosus TaxID=72105 RepID=UPI00189C94EE|nr:tumor necrosis factor receptor superfamily member 9a [Sebastes umbrosus]
MAGILLPMVLSLLMQGCLCSVGETDRGCMKWTSKGEDVCCEACHPGHRVVTKCGRNPKELCTPCKNGTFLEDPKDSRCYPCTQCVGAQVYVKQCTTSTDTQCGCKEGFTCGNDRCTFCVKKCDKGQEPAEKRSCRTCPDGRFNDQIHQMCKPWSTKCPNPAQHIVANGDAFTDIKCADASPVPVIKPEKPDPTEPASPFALFAVISIVVLMAFGIGIIIIITKKVSQKRKDEEEGQKPTTKTLIIRPPTDDDDPRTLQAIECSFHEAQQEQGSSSESLDSKDSSDRLIA